MQKLQNKLNIKKIFKTIQGEGKYEGYPALFIRLAGCNLNCDFCDTDWKDGELMSVEEVVKIIDNSGMDLVVWTGGEPTLQLDNIIYTIGLLEKPHIQTIETNGTRLKEMLEVFAYVSCSPKDLKTTKKAVEFFKTYPNDYDIKIVTDLEKEGVDSLEYATILMPLTTFNKDKDLELRKKVWDYCVEHKVKYCDRIHINVWNGVDNK